jgi:8-oxo-dGTP diphosphatase
VPEESGSPAQLAAFTMALLRGGDRYLMLQRSPSKRFAPNRWTGIGGRVEPHELDDLNAAALREIAEETGIPPHQVQHLALHRVLLQQRQGHPITVLLYFTGEVDPVELSSTDEGTLHWLTETELESIDIIENTAAVIPLLIDDMKHTHREFGAPILGTATFDDSGQLLSLSWQPDRQR